MGERGRPREYLRIKEFNKFVNNDFYHLQCDVKFNRKLLWVILAALIGAALFDRISLLI